MTFSPLQIQILTAAAGDLAEWSKAEPISRKELSKLWGVDHLYLRNARIAAAVEGRQVPVNVERWLGRRPTPSEAASFSRALRTLEAKGLVVRVSDTRIRGQQQYTRNIRFTKLGEEIAAELLSQITDSSMSVESTATAPNSGTLMEVC